MSCLKLAESPPPPSGGNGLFFLGIVNDEDDDEEDFGLPMLWEDEDGSMGLKLVLETI
jgi:hypothetical protein